MFSKKAQAATEFVLLASFMLFIFIGMFTVVGNKINEIEREKAQRRAGELLDFVQNEIMLADSVSIGYQRYFILPLTIDNVDYNITIVDDSEIVLWYKNEEYVDFLDQSVNGTIGRGKNLIIKDATKKIKIVNHSSLCGDGIIQNPNFNGFNEECEDDLDCDFSESCINCKCE
jgi:hypothetical protein